MVGGSIYTGTGGLDTAIVSALVLVLSGVIFLLYLRRPFLAYAICVSIAVSDLFSLLPYTVYKVEGFARLDDAALVITFLYIFLSKSRRESGHLPFRKEGLLLVSYLLFQAVYTLVGARVLPWDILREARSYLQILWVFTVPFFVRNELQIKNLVKFVAVGTVFNMVLYSLQVIFRIRLGYVDAQS
ncbi:MAG: hypothetical protein M1339_03160, partial [Bacteroidetes bacterium]|nr:hypothetical protein [Bacteroidota bacterium]